MKDKRLKIFFSGIAGSGVSAIAGFMADRGHIVSGSDRAFDMNPDHFLRKAFIEKGVELYQQDGSGINRSIDLAVFSTAVEPDRPEIKKSKELGVTVKTRPQYLSEITSSFRTIAVSGTSGKSTTSGLLAFLMNRLGMNPNFIGGGRVKELMPDSKPVNSLTGSSAYLIIEACESDGTIINYRPEHTIILNLSLDHHSIDRTSGMFGTLISNTKEMIIINNDDRNLEGIKPEGAVTFSIDSPSRYRAEEIIYGPFSTEFTLNGIRFTLSIPGKHNLYNSLSSIALLSETGISLNDISVLLPEFKGIDRRFDIHLNSNGRLVIDDYAHNPHKIASLIETVQRFKEGVCYIFQPHGFGPTRMMKKEYIEVFSKKLHDSDHLIILPIFYAGGTASRDISSDDLADGIRLNHKSAEVIEKRSDLLKRIVKYKIFVIFGARDESLSEFAEEIADTLRDRHS